MSVEEEFEMHLEAVISRIHQFLSSNFALASETRDLNQHQNSLLLELDSHSFQYRQLAGTLAIQSYTHYIVQLLSGCEPLLEVTALIFANLSEARSQTLKIDAPQLQDVLQQAWLNLGKLAEITHKLFPRSPMVAVHNSFLEQAGSDPSETIYGRLYDQNLHLKSQLEQNNRQLLELELKLTKILQQNDGCDRNMDSSFRFQELREQLAIKNEEIDKMNEQFAIQIDKYNTVYEAMKRQIEDLKDFRQADMVDLVERLQTEIVKLRQEKERDDIIIRELRLRDNYLSSHRKGNSYSRVYY